MKLKTFFNQNITAIKYVIRYALQIPSIHVRTNESLPDIFLFATRRGGSTLARDILYTQPGINYIDQPFDLTDLQFNPYRSKIPNPSESQFIAFSYHEMEEIKEYFSKLLNNKNILRSQWNWFDDSFKWRYDRYVVKILSAKAMIEWFEKEFSCQIIYLLRHPAPTALSVVKRNWIYTALSYLKSDTFVKYYVPKGAYNFSMDIIKKGNPLEKHVLEWCLENRVPLLLYKKKDWLTINYENILIKPKETVNALCSFLKLTEPDKMLNAIKKPTKTAWDSKKDILRVDTKLRLKSWMNNIDSSTVKVCSEILEKYEINEYRMDYPLPIQDENTHH